MPTSDAQKRATLKWDRANADKITVKLSKTKEPTKASIQQAAEREGLSMNAWIIECIMDKLEGE